MHRISPDRDRQPIFERGAQFYEENGKTMFVFRMDPSSQVGPIPATDQHKEKHLEAYAAYQRARNADAIARVAPETEEPERRGPGRPRKVH